MIAPAMLEDFADDGHVRGCVDYDSCDCRLRLLAVARGTRAALESTPAIMSLTLEQAGRIRGLDVEEVGDVEDGLILVRQLRAVLGAMLSPAPFGKEAVTGLHVYGRVLDQLQAYLLEWGEFALEHPDRVPRAT